MLKCAVYFPPQSLSHIGFPFFSEKPERLRILGELFDEEKIPVILPKKAELSSVLRAHTKEYIEHVESISKMSLIPATIANILSEYVQWYTRVSPGSYKAALYAAGTVCQAVEDTIAGRYTRSFCAIRPPGHHAGREKGEGFCLFNNVAIGVLHAISLGYKRITVIDFDRHHGNGTQDIVSKNPYAKTLADILFVSSYQEGCKYSIESESNRNTGIVLVPLPEYCNGQHVVDTYKTRIIPVVHDFKPDLIFISAGFDMHVSDPLTNIQMEAEDYYELTKLITDASNTLCGGRVISVLEGGYNLPALKECVYYHLRALTN